VVDLHLGDGLTGLDVLAAYRYWARTGHAYAAQVTRAEVHPGVGDGTLTIYVAGPSGVIADAGIIAAVQAWVNTNKARTDDVTVTAASARAVSVTGTVRVRAANDSAANRALATDALAAYFAGLGIGDDVDLGALYHAIYSATGVVDVDLDAPAADVSVNNDEVAVPTVALTWVTV
jgi:phage-related baseplate assembly protein